jgi:pyruvate formate lyase activating enzyme
MIIGGFEKFSLQDYPGKICAVIFTQGCNFRCPFCHNPELVNPDLFFESIPEDDIIHFLASRSKKLDGITITGGEPTIQAGLLKFMRRVKNLGFLVKLDTNGSNPEIIQTAIEQNFVDFIAMDIKAPLWKYHEIANVKVEIEKVEKSIDVIKKSGVEYQFRTTKCRALLSPEDLIFIGEWMKDSSSHVFQEFVSYKVLNPELLKEKNKNPSYPISEAFLPEN